MYLLIVTGLSGAGKSQALRSLEERGYYCVDNLPSSMLSGFAEICMQAVPRILKAAVVIDSRESLLSRSAQSMVQAVDALTVNYEILFLDARDDVLKKRYNEVRRRHPLGDAGEAETGVARERAYLQSMRDRANYIIDTSDVKPQDFDKFLAKVLPDAGTEEMTLLLCSFGYKRGVPVDADIVLDMRFMPNPFYYPEFRPQSGLDKPVRDFVLAQPYVKPFLDGIEHTLRQLLPLYQKQDKRILRVCFGCTGGRHRSVAAAEDMARRFLNQGVTVRVFHRDLEAEADAISQRFRKDQ